MRKAKKQFRKNYPEPLGYTNVVFNCGSYGVDDERALEEARARKNDHRIDKVIFVSSDGEAKEI